MTGIVVVSHSRALADAAVALAGEMLHDTTARISVAAGLDDLTFGTDAAAIGQAIVEADDGTGVVVLMDLGSAVLSAELALEFLDPVLAERVVLCPAALVEGLVVAAVAAAGGATPHEVASEAVNSLVAKQGHLPMTRAAERSASPSEIETGGSSAPAQHLEEHATARAIFEVGNVHGLHARPAARLVQEAGQFDARIELRNLTTAVGPVPARSLTRVATLGALRGHRVEMIASGLQAEAAIESLIALAGRDFDEQPADVTATFAAQEPPELSGRPRPASPGIAIGPAWSFGTSEVVVGDEPAGAVADEWNRVLDAVEAVRLDIARVRADASGTVGESAAAIFDAHLVLLDDPDLLDGVRRRIDIGAAAPRAWVDSVGDIAASLAAISDPYLRARAADVRAVGQQVVRVLVGDDGQRLDGVGVLIAEELEPAHVAELDPTRVVGIVMTSGSATGHSAILARSRGIPAVVGAGAAYLSVATGTTIALDGSTGEVTVDPDASVLVDLRRRSAQADARASKAIAAARLGAATRDGVEILVGANLGSLQDAHAAENAGADLAGLVRTEFLFLGRDKAPSVDEQVDAYAALATALNGRRLTLRTLDVGGDKPLPYAPQAAEANPFLGMRGIRLALSQRDLLNDQLEAIVRVAHETPVSVMFPMISTVDELMEARRRLDGAIDLVAKGTPAHLHVGIMVEVPSTAVKAAAFAPHVDFFSIGTNDLTQYAMAAERGNAAVAGLADAVDPGVLGLISSVCRAAAGRAVVAVCGELAADESAVPLLVALGVRELSVSPRAIPGVKQAVRRADAAAGLDLAARCLAADGASDVRRQLSQNG